MAIDTLGTMARDEPAGRPRRRSPRPPGKTGTRFSRAPRSDGQPSDRSGSARPGPRAARGAAPAARRGRPPGREPGSRIDGAPTGGRRATPRQAASTSRSGGAVPHRDRGAPQPRKRQGSRGTTQRDVTAPTAARPTSAVSKAARPAPAREKNRGRAQPSRPYRSPHRDSAPRDQTTRRSPTNDRTERAGTSRTSAPSGRAPRGGAPTRRVVPPDPPRSWGSVARRGARTLGARAEPAGGPARQDRHVGPSRSGPRPTASDEVWLDEGVVGDDALGPSRRRGGKARTPIDGRGDSRRDRREAGDVVPHEVAEELRVAGGRAAARRLADRMAVAAGAYERDRYPEVLRITRPVIEAAPTSAAAHELYGLASYRLGRWREAVRHLEQARSLSGGDPAQLPVLMDCQRALGRHRRVEALWKELRDASPPADVLVEGRLVMAADLAERGELSDAIALLTSAGAARNLRHPAERHVRQWYVLGDLYERAGDVPRARELFARVADADPDLADASDRLASLGAATRSASRSGRRAPRRPR